MRKVYYTDKGARVIAYTDSWDEPDTCEVYGYYVERWTGYNPDVDEVYGDEEDAEAEAQRLYEEDYAEDPEGAVLYPVKYCDG
jgi:hypothetical protein